MWCHQQFIFDLHAELKAWRCMFFLFYFALF